MSEEEKEAIETLKDLKNIKWYSHAFDNGTEILDEEEKKDIDIVVNYISNLQKENEELNRKRLNGTLSDGYHTYNELYYQRCILFATICNSNKNISWKSKRHNDGKKCFDSDNWFIVGIDTLEGSYTYHYEMKYWDLFNIQELEKGKEWDGHTEKDVTRLLSLEKLTKNLQKENEELKQDNSHQWEERCKLTFEIERLQKELDKKDKVIDELIMLLLEFDIAEIYCAKIKDCFEVADGKCFDCIKQYFYKKAEDKEKDE